MPFHNDEEKRHEYAKARELLRRSRLTQSQRKEEWRTEYKRLYRQNEIRRQYKEQSEREYVAQKKQLLDGWNQLFPGEDITT